MRNSNAEILGKADTLYSRKQWLFALFARNNLTVWFHQPNGQWVALNTLRYDRSVQF
jgi:hypothetical protein